MDWVYIYFQTSTNNQLYIKLNSLFIHTGEIYICVCVSVYNNNSNNSQFLDLRKCRKKKKYIMTTDVQHRL